MLRVMYGSQVLVRAILVGHIWLNGIIAFLFLFIRGLTSPCLLVI